MKSAFWFCSLLLLSSIVITANAQRSTDASQKRYIKVPAGYLMVLRQGDNIFGELETLAVQEKIASASISGMGFVNATFGYFNRDTKQYDPKQFFDMELAGMNGSIAWQDGQPSLHLHGVVTDKDFSAHGGHMLAATVSTGSLEIMITTHPQKLQRIKDPELGANVLQLH